MIRATEQATTTIREQFTTDELIVPLRDAYESDSFGQITSYESLSRLLDVLELIELDAAGTPTPQVNANRAFSNSRRDDARAEERITHTPQDMAL